MEKADGLDHDHADSPAIRMAIGQPEEVRCLRLLGHATSIGQRAMYVQSAPELSPAPAQQGLGRRYGTGVTRAFPFSIICIARIFIPEVVHASWIAPAGI